HRAAHLDPESRQQTFTHYVENRRAWIERSGVCLEIPKHFCVARGEKIKQEENEAVEFAGFAEAITATEQSFDFIVVDTPGTDTYLMRLAHSVSDTLIPPPHKHFVLFYFPG